MAFVIDDRLGPNMRCKMKKHTCPLSNVLPQPHQTIYLFILLFTGIFTDEFLETSVNLGNDRQDLTSSHPVRFCRSVHSNQVNDGKDTSDSREFKQIILPLKSNGTLNYIMRTAFESKHKHRLVVYKVADTNQYWMAR